MGNDSLPWANRPEAILGISITFLCVAWLAVSLRLYVRCAARFWGWDDAWVFMASLSNTAGVAITCLLPGAGMGHHFWTLSHENVMEYFKYIYSSNITYAASATFIKLAILFQYLRLFDMQSNLARRLTKAVIVFIAMWGTVFFFLALFACTPIAKNWNFRLPGRCIAFGSKEGPELFASFLTHASSNMVLDFVVLLLPVPFLKGLRMRSKTRIGLIALFVMGTIVATISIGRLVALADHRAGTIPIFDPTFAAPPIYILTVLEINVAILLASIPIFWPLVSSLATNKILVVNEIQVYSARRESDVYGLSQFPDDGGENGGESRVSIIMESAGVKPGGMNSKHHRGNPLHTKKESASSFTQPIELGRRISQESNKKLAHKRSNPSFSRFPSNTPDEGSPVGGILARSGSTRSQGRRHYDDRYVQDWVVPDFDKPGGTYTTTVERAEVPFDHIGRLEK